jgi:kinesin family protein 18/19
MPQPPHVCVRIRPLHPSEASSGHRSAVLCSEESPAQVCISKQERNGGVLFSDRGSSHEFAFDAVFPPETTQEQVFAASAARVIPQVLAGNNATVIAYGCTGSGKTHTMIGNDDGVIPQAMQALFSGLGAGTTVTASYLEIYNETVRDLLGADLADKPLTPCESAEDGQVHILGLTEREVGSVEATLRLVCEGNARRRTEATAANAASSRSHAILQIQLVFAAQQQRQVLGAVDPNLGHARNARRQSVGPKSGLPRRTSRLSLIDLAGSERAAATMNRGVRLREGANINRSLLALANCINALALGTARAKFRDSKLTHLLKASLVGECAIVLIATLNPSHKSYDESLNTLKYANRAKDIRPVASPARSLRGTANNSRSSLSFSSTSPLSTSCTSSATSVSTTSVREHDAVDSLRRQVAALQTKLAAVTAERDLLRCSAVTTTAALPCAQESAELRPTKLRQPTRMVAARKAPVIAIDLSGGE